MHVSCLSHTWFIYNLNTIFIRCDHTCAVLHNAQHFHEYRSIDKSLHPVSFFAHFSTLCINEPHRFTYLEIPFWWSRCECPSILVPGWWSTAHPLFPNPPPPLPAVTIVHVTCLQRQHHNISYTIWYTKGFQQFGTVHHHKKKNNDMC